MRRAGLGRAAAYLALALALAITSCDEPGRPFVPLPGGDLIVDSEPRGGGIRLNGVETGLLTPDTLFELPETVHEVVILLDTVFGLTYGWRELVLAPPRGLTGEYLRPLVRPCTPGLCPGWTRWNDVNNVRIAWNPAGALFYHDGSGFGIFWPAGESHSYAAVGLPLFAGVIAGTTDTVALGPYDVGYLYGRPVPDVTVNPEFRLAQESWVLPTDPPRGTVRGLSIHQEVTPSQGVPDAFLIRLTYTNITNDPLYRTTDRQMPVEGIAYESVYLAFAMDADIGHPNVSGSATDDLVSYVPDLGLVFTYDSDFHAPQFGEWTEKPALVGLQMVERPEGTETYMNAWVRITSAGSLDWSTGNPNQRVGWRWLSATQTILPNHPHPSIGFAPADTDQANDYRMLVSAGPLTLAPGESAEIVVAVLLAEPVPGTFTSGTRVAPGDPTVSQRPITAVAATLIERAATIAP